MSFGGSIPLCASGVAENFTTEFTEHTEHTEYTEFGFMFFIPAFPSVFLYSTGDENIPHLRNAADPRNALVFHFAHSSKPLCGFATSRDAFFVLFVFFVVVAIIWNLARRAAMSRKNGGVTFPRQAAKRAKANRERNGSVGQRWKLWTRKAGRMFEGAGTFNP